MNIYCFNYIVLKKKKTSHDIIYRVINHTSKLRSDIQDEIIDTNLPELHITTKVNLLH